MTASQRVGELERDADAGRTRLALLAVMGALRDIETRHGEGSTVAPFSLRFHPDGSGQIEDDLLEALCDEPEAIFTFENVNQFAAWLAATPSQRSVIEAAERSTRGERRRTDFAKLDLLAAEAGRPC